MASIRPSYAPYDAHMHHGSNTTLKRAYTTPLCDIEVDKDYKDDDEYIQTIQDTNLVWKPYESREKPQDSLEPLKDAYTMLAMELQGFFSS